LDVAAMGINRVQREGLSLQHPARIALVGTMNQEEGELRPQLLDRFGMMVEVRAPLEPGLRTEIVRRRLAWETDPQDFIDAWQPRQRMLREQVLRAQALLPKVVIADGLLVLISELCCDQGVTSLRADLVMNKAARALAALNGRSSVHPDDLAHAAMLVLPHRRRTKPFERPGLDEGELDRFLGKAMSSAAGNTRSPEGPHGNAGDPVAGNHGTEDANELVHGGARGDGAGAGAQSAKNERGANVREGCGDGGGEVAQQVFAPSALARVPRIELKSGAIGAGVVGRRSVAVEARRGREVRAVADEQPTDLAVTATLHHSLLRTGGLSPDGRLEVTRRDLHQKVKVGRQGNLILFVVDASGSMAALRRMQMVKGTVLALLQDAYQRRDEVGVITFRGTEAEVLLSPTRSVETAEHHLRELPTGGRTPLAQALRLADDLLSRASSPSRPEPLLILLSDGRANVALDEQGDPWEQSLQCARTLAGKRTAALVLDTEVGYVRMGRARELAAALGAQCLSVEQFNAESLSLTIRGLP
jgi:magnesium chelatase subunit D